MVTEILGTLVLGILILIAFLVKSPAPHGASFIFTHGPLHGQTPWYAASLALLMGAFTIGGFEASADLGEEAVGVQRTVARAIIGAVAISGVIGMITLICFAIGIPNLSAIASSPTPIAYMAKFWFGSAFSRVFLVTVAYSVFALMVVQVAAIGRLIYSLSRDNMFPASKFFAGVEAKRKTPIAALVLTTLLYIAVMVFAAVKGNAYVYLIGATPVFASVVYLMIVVAYWLRRNTHPEVTGLRPRQVGRAAARAVADLGGLPHPGLHPAVHLPRGRGGVRRRPDRGRPWYFFGLRGRLRRGEAGQALSKGKLAGADVLAATAGAAPAGPAQPEAGAGRVRP